ncbi:hypothetical protein ACFFMN_06400 [Planobispora siamensis]|uniref:Uncharacterized protein n=1 Tax=Planobispora siamensis TaxID=936338 RepID=A0A8J3WJB9_9ACTN|nr:hypothetical protein [Planobispora siamensis]GIH92779.1 hypothetical protein Psi01_34090 [Planobispora siamensis]
MAVENAQYDRNNPDNSELAKAFFQEVDRATQQAYLHAVSVPSLGPLTGLNGYTRRWGEMWADFLQGKAVMCMAACFGYVIETFVSDQRSGLAHRIPDGYTVTPQMTHGGTRPDLVLAEKSGREIAWVDLTASQSVDHIFDKAGWSKQISIFAEVTYPSLDPQSLTLMRQNKDNTGTLSQQEFDQRIKQAAETYAQVRKEWLSIGEIMSLKFLGDEIGRSAEEQRLNPEIRQDHISEEIRWYFNLPVPPDKKLVPSILTALGVRPASWGFTTGYPASQRAGETWLIDNAPQLLKQG